MRILHVVASLAPRHGGPTEAVLGMVRALRAEGMEASILSSNDDLGDALNVPLHEWTLHEGVPCYFIPRVKSQQHTLIGFTYAPGFVPWLKQHVRDYDFIHVHTVFSFPANMAMSIARKAGVPYAVRPLGQLCRWSMAQRSLIKKAQLSLITRRNINGAAFIHATSRMEAGEIAEMNFTSVCKVLPHGLDLPPAIDDARTALRAELRLPQDRMIVVFMSRFHEKKGIELLLQACAEIQDQPFDLVLAGTGDDCYVESLKQRIAALRLTNIHWHGFAINERKWRLLQGADLFVLPSHSENFGIAVLEAVACGLPVIVSDQVALADEVVANRLGRAVPVEVKALARAISELLNSPDERTAIRARATTIATERFGWPAAAQRLIAAYRESMEIRPSQT